MSENDAVIEMVGLRMVKPGGGLGLPNWDWAPPGEPRVPNPEIQDRYGGRESLTMQHGDEIVVPATLLAQWMRHPMFRIWVEELGYFEFVAPERVTHDVCGPLVKVENTSQRPIVIAAVSGPPVTLQPGEYAMLPSEHVHRLYATGAIKLGSDVQPKVHNLPPRRQR